MRHVVLSGASGFIGSHVQERLLREPELTLTAVARRTAAPGDVEVDLLDAGSISDIVKDCDAFVHLAGVIDINASLEAPRQRIEENVTMLLNVLEAIRVSEKKPLIIFASTDRVYGATKKKNVDENEPPVPIEPYTAAKLMCEALLEMYGRVYEIPYIILRLDSVYGPRQPRAMFISDVIQKMIAQDEISTGDLSVQKNFIYVGDVAEAIIAALNAPISAHNTTYNIGGAYVSLEKLARTIQKNIERRLKKTIKVVSSNAGQRPARIEVRPFKLSTAKAARQLKWKPKTTLTDGLERTITYFLEAYEKDKSR